MNIKVIFSSGGRYNKNPEQKIADDETVDTAKKIANALQEVGHEAELVKITPFRINRVKSLNTDVVFNMCEWSGRDSHLGIQVLKTLEDNKIPYTGADSTSYDWCCNKVVMKKMFDELGVLTPNWTVIYPTDNLSSINKKVSNLRYPLIIKPAYEHCAIGIDNKSIVSNIDDSLKKVVILLKEYKQPIIVEEYIKGREFTLTVVRNHTLHIFPPAEVVFNEDLLEKQILSFDTKWSHDDSFNSVVLEDQELSIKLKNIAREVFEKMNCKGYVRIDTRIRNGEVYVLEVNVNPSILPEDNYGLTVSTEAGGWNFVKLVDEIANAAVN